MPIRRPFVAALLLAAASASGQTAAIQRRVEAGIVPRDIARSSVRGVALSLSAATIAPSVALNGASQVLASPSLHLAAPAAGLPAQRPWSAVFSEFPVVLLGEDHSNLWIVDSLTHELPRLKDAGLTHLGLEGYASTLQPKIDDHLAHGGSVPGDDGRYRSGQYRALFEKARELGVRLLAIDMPDGLRQRLVARLERRFAANPALAERLTPPERARPLGPREAADLAVTLDWRNRYMARTVERARRPNPWARRDDPSAKFLLFVGAAHAKRVSIPIELPRGILPSPGLADIGEVLERRAGIPALSVRVVGGREGVEKVPEAQWFASEAGQPAGWTRLSPKTAVWNLGRTTPASPRLSLLSQPLREHVELGPVARTVHVSYKVLAQVAKVWLAWTLMPTPEAAIGALIYLGYRLPATLAEFTAQTAIDLSLRYWWRKLKVLKELARQPGVSRLRVLTFSRVRFSGLIARSADKEGLVFVESSQDLPESVGRFGAPIPIEDMSGSQARLVLADDRGFSPRAWTPTVSELLDGHPIPAGIARAWRAHLEESERGRSRLTHFLDFSQDRELHLEAHLLGAAGEETRLGAIASGSAVRKLIGLGRLGRLLGRTPVPRAIALTDSRVEKPGTQREAGLRAAFGRAWRRLTGRLIVVKDQKVPRRLGPKSSEL